LSVSNIVAFESNHVLSSEAGATVEEVAPNTLILALSKIVQAAGEVQTRSAVRVAKAAFV